MNHGDQERCRDWHVSHQMLVGEYLGAELIDLGLGEGTDPVGERVLLIVGELGDLRIGILEEVRIGGVVVKELLSGLC